MNHTLHGPLAVDLLRRFAVVVQERLTEPYDLATGVGDCNHAGDAVHGQASLVLAFAQLLLSALLIVDVGDKTIPASDPAFCVVHRKNASLGPSIEAIGPPITELTIEG